MSCFYDLKTGNQKRYILRNSKRTLYGLSELAREPSIIVNMFLTIPYETPYERWTLKGMLDLQHDILIAEELWNFIGGEGTYEELLDAFEEAGMS